MDRAPIYTCSPAKADRSDEFLTPRLQPRIRAGALVVLAIASCSIALPGALDAATYYVDFVSGADTNNGTSKATPWKHVKGMLGCANICNSSTPVGGDTVIFRGGVTWTSSFQWLVV